MKVLDARRGQLSAGDLAGAVEVLKGGDAVAFPTETVYGLGALAMDEEAVGRIFEIKGRPATNPLIVHGASVEVIKGLVGEWTPRASCLAGAFWPGPLTLVLPRGGGIPDLVTAGLETVGVRVPAHGVARQLLEAAGPMAAPSANRYTELSPTRVEHVVRGLGERVRIVVDGGSCDVGVESTILSLAGEEPVLLRPGMVGKEALEEVLGCEVKAMGGDGYEDEVVRPSPGLSKKHYSPRAVLEVCESAEFRARLGRGERGVAFLGMDDGGEKGGSEGGEALFLPGDPQGYAAQLYAGLHHLDIEGVERIVLARPPRGKEWAAIWDRLGRAATVT